MKASGILLFLLRESRGGIGRLGFFTACVAIGVAAVVAVAGMSAAVEEGLRSHSRELLAADLAVQAYRELPDELDAALEELAPGSQRMDVRELATMCGAFGADGKIARSRLAELKVVDGDYPWYGALELQPAGVLAELLDETAAVLAPELLSGLGLALGDTVRIGGADFRIAGLVVDEPDRLDFQITLGPRVFLSRAGFDRTDLLGVGNRVKYRALVRVPGNPTKEVLEDLRDGLRESLADHPGLRYETHFDAQPGVRRGLERFESFLGLVALLSLIVGGIGVAQVVRAWLEAKSMDVAVWRSLGLRPREVLGLQLLHAALLALAGSLIGALLGGVVPFVLPRVAPGLLSPDLVRGWQPLAVLRGVALGVGVAVLFALPALTAVWRVPPALVLRSEAAPLAAPRVVRALAFAVLFGGLFASAWIQGGDALHALWFTAGLSALALSLWLGARLLIRVAASIPRRRLGPYLAHGFAALARPGAGTVGAIVALGLGALVVLGMAAVQARLSDELEGVLPEDAPSVFLVDVQPDQWEGVERILAEGGATEVQAVPVLMARLTAIDGKSVRELMEEREREPDGRRRSRWGLTREQRLTWLTDLPESNRIVAGELWGDPEAAEVSLEEDFADGLGVGLGSRLAFDVLGFPVELVVTSLRAVEWESFAVNFYVVVEPGVLDDAPQMRLAAAKVDAAEEDRVQNRLVEGYPNVTMLRVRSILEKVRNLLAKIALGVRLLGGFTVLAGLAILAGSVGATQLRRARETALLKTLGVTRRGVLGLFLTEFLLSGAVASALGVLGAWMLAWAFLEHVVELEAELSPGVFVVGGIMTTLLAVLAGLATSARALRVRPLETLRG